MNSNLGIAIAGAVIIIAAAGAGGVALWQQSASPKKAEPAAVQWHSCYQEEVKGPVATYAVDEHGVPKGWHRQIVAVLTSHRASPSGLPADIMAMPDLSGAHALPNLRVALATEREDRKSDLLNAVQKFREKQFDSLFAPDEKALDEMREILFLWAGVATVAPDSRGPFIDAREIAFLEKLLENPFYQIGRYPNPLPMSAAALKDAFAVVRNHYFAELAAQGPARTLLDYSGGYPALNAGIFQTLSGRAAGLPTPEDKLHFWQRAISAIPYDVREKLQPEERRFLDALIRKSTPELNLQNVLATLQPDLAKGPDYYDRLGRRVIFRIAYSNKMNSRLTCYLYPDQ